MFQSHSRRGKELAKGLSAAYFLPLRLCITNSTATSTTAIAITATNISLVLSLVGLVVMLPITRPELVTVAATVLVSMSWPLIVRVWLPGEAMMVKLPLASVLTDVPFSKATVMPTRPLPLPSAIFPLMGTSVDSVTETAED